MWVTILQLLLLRQANLRRLGNSPHLHHQCNEASSQKGASTLISNETLERSPKLAQSTVLCQSQSTSTRGYPTSATVFAFVFIFRLNKEQSLKLKFFFSFSISCNSFVFTVMKIYLLHRFTASEKLPKHESSVLGARDYRKSRSTERSVSCQSYKKSFLMERSLSFLLKSRSKGNAELTAKNKR
jgi:hypothetical protein